MKSVSALHPQTFPDNSSDTFTVTRASGQSNLLLGWMPATLSYGLCSKCADLSERLPLPIQKQRRNEEYDALRN